MEWDRFEFIINKMLQYIYLNVEIAFIKGACGPTRFTNTCFQKISQKTRQREYKEVRRRGAIIRAHI